MRASGIDGLTRDFYLRQLWDGKGSAVVDAMDPSTLTAYASLCGQGQAAAATGRVTVEYASPSH